MESRALAARLNLRSLRIDDAVLAALDGLSETDQRDVHRTIMGLRGRTEPRPGDRLMSPGAHRWFAAANARLVLVYCFDGSNVSVENVLAMHRDHAAGALGA